MTIEEKEILAFIDKSSHPVDISEIRGVFKEFEVQTINNLTTQGYIEELERVGTVYSIEGKEDFTYVVYRVKEKGHAKLKGHLHWAWFNFSTNSAPWIGIATILFGSISLLLNSISLNSNIEASKNETEAYRMLNRPYIYFGLTPTEELQNIEQNKLVFYVFNAGRLPGYKTRIQVQSENKELSNVYSDEFTGYVIAPNDKLRMSVQLDATSTDIFMKEDLIVKITYIGPDNSNYCALARGVLFIFEGKLALLADETNDCSEDFSKKTSSD